MYSSSPLYVPHAQPISTPSSHHPYNVWRWIQSWSHPLCHLHSAATHYAISTLLPLIMPYPLCCHSLCHLIHPAATHYAISSTLLPLIMPSPPCCHSLCHLIHSAATHYAISSTLLPLCPYKAWLTSRMFHWTAPLLGSSCWLLFTKFCLLRCQSAL